MVRSNLPDSIRLSTGEVLKPVIGGHLGGKPFLTLVDVTKNGWLADLPIGTTEISAIISESKKQKRKYRRVAIMSRNLRGKLDLHGRPYRPSVWVFVQL